MSVHTERVGDMTQKVRHIESETQNERKRKTRALIKKRRKNITMDKVIQTDTCRKRAQVTDIYTLTKLGT